MNLLVIHGPNLNLLGTREPQTYGLATIADIDDQISTRAAQLGVAVRIVQRSAEGAIIDDIHSAVGWADAIIVNPAGYTHYSVAIRDALAAVGLPAVEVHLTNIAAREQFRWRSVVSGVVTGVISGLGTYGYLAAMEFLVREDPRTAGTPEA